jgi:protein tyrosine phosphatase (PTP) superfamily phosphohydrolase (DUF442 family)
MADPEIIYHWRRLDDRITTSGQPTEPQLEDIHALGIRHIVNLGLHSHEKALPDETASVSRLGMTYIHIPVDFQNPTDQDFDQFCAVMEQLKDVPVHVHCIANYRVSAFFYRYRRDALGMDEARARADMEEVWHPEGVWAAFIERSHAICRLTSCWPTHVCRLLGRISEPRSALPKPLAFIKITASSILGNLLAHSRLPLAWHEQLTLLGLYLSRPERPRLLGAISVP